MPNKDLRIDTRIVDDSPPLNHSGERIESVKIFVAMPTSDFGHNAFYDTPELVRENLLDPVCEKVAILLQLHLSRVELKIEKDKTKGGDIYQSMYREAADADVYIADLTGSNPNVYLELGVRWAFRESVTIPIVQNPDDLRFNVSKARVQVYTPKTIQKAINDIAKTIVSGLTEHNQDSPILSSTDVVWMKRHVRDELEHQVQVVRRSEMNGLLDQAKDQDNLPEKIVLLKQAVEIAPTSSVATRSLGVALRMMSDYTASEALLRRAIDNDAADALSFRELGVTLGKAGKNGEAIEYLREAIRLNSEDAEAYNNLGGALRRAAESDPNGWSVRDLKESHACYQKALRLNQFDIYAALNVARTGMILSHWDGSYREPARLTFQQQIHLARYIVSLESTNAWRWLDLADCCLFTGEFSGAKENLQCALDRVQPEARLDTTTSYLRPLKVLLNLKVLDRMTGKFIRELVQEVGCLTLQTKATV
jgi:tetratricopeptide (TPR) repeat protein